MVSKREDMVFPAGLEGPDMMNAKPCPKSLSW